MRHRIAGCLAIVALIGAAATLRADTEDDADVRILKAAGLKPDAAEVCEFIRRLGPSPNDEARVTTLIRQLSDARYEARQAATQEVISLGPKALAALRAASRSEDPEAAQRAEGCLRQVEGTTKPTLISAAIHYLSRSQHPDAAAAILHGIVAIDDSVADEWHGALVLLAQSNPVHREALAASIRDGNPIRRVAAARALIAAKCERATEIARPVLTDSSPFVRFRVGMALAAAGERDGLAAVIAALPALSAEQLSDADEFLSRLVGDQSPPLVTPNRAESRRAYHQAWEAWWKQNGATVNLTAIAGNAAADSFLVAAGSRAAATGSVLEISFAQAPDSQDDSKRRASIRRRIDNLGYPVAVEALPRGRVLIAEHRGNKVTERDFKGNIRWEREIEQPVSCQRVPGGGVLIANASEVLCVNHDGGERFRFAVDGAAAATRRRDGTIAVATNQGSCFIFDESGAPKHKFAIVQTLQITTIQSLPNGNLLIPSFAENQVIEYDILGHKVWTAETRRPNAAIRLPNGHVLVASSVDGIIREIDHAGRVIRESRPGGELRYVGIAAPK